MLNCIQNYFVYIGTLPRIYDLKIVLTHILIAKISGVEDSYLDSSLMIKVALVLLSHCLICTVTVNYLNEFLYVNNLTSLLFDFVRRC